MKRKSKRVLSFILLFQLLVTIIGTAVPLSLAATDNRWEAYKGKTIAVQVGTIFDEVARDILSADDIQSFTTMLESLDAVKLGRADAALIDDIIINQLRASGSYDNLAYIPLPSEIYRVISSNVIGTAELCDKYNTYLAEIKANGTFDDMWERWVNTVPNSPMPDIALTGTNGTLRAASSMGYAPFCFLGDNGEAIGFDVENSKRFAAWLGMDLKLIDTDYASQINLVQSGKVDMTMSGFTVTADRGLNVRFSDTYVANGAVLAVRKENSAPVTSNSLSWEDYKGKTFAVVTGTIADRFINDNMNPSEAFYFPDAVSAATAIRLGKVEAMVYDTTVIKTILADKSFSECVSVLIPAEKMSFHSGAISVNQELLNKFNAFLAEIRANGRLDEIYHRWLDPNDASKVTMPDIPLTGENGTLKIAISSGELPFVFLAENNTYKGFDIELSQLFAQSLGMNIEYVDLEFSGLIASVKSGRTDLGISNIAITEERGTQVTFSDPYIEASFSILVKSPKAAAGNSGNWEDFKGKKFSVMVGSVFDEVAEKTFNASEKLYFNNVTEELEAVKLGKTDAALLDSAVVNAVLASGSFDELTVLPVDMEELKYEYGVFFNDAELRAQYNSFLAQIKADGTLDDMTSRWITNFTFEAKVPEIKLSGENGKLTVAAHDGYTPFAYHGEDGLTGFDIEQLTRFAAYLGKDVEFTGVDFSAMIAYVTSGKADIGSSVYITEERQQVVSFGEPDYVSSTMLVVRKDSLAPADNRTWESFKGMKATVLEGSIYDKAAIDIMQAAEVTYLQDDASIFTAVLQGKADYTLMNDTTAKIMLTAPSYSNLTSFIISPEVFSDYSGAISMNQEIVDKYNLFLAEIKADGTLDDMKIRWLDNFDRETMVMPDIPLSGENGTLKVATNSAHEPYAYVGNNGELLGFEIEHMRRFAAYLGMDVEFSSMAFAGIIPYVTSGKADIGVSNINITEERKKSVLFTEPYKEGYLVVIAQKAVASTKSDKESLSFFAVLKNAVQSNLITEGRWKLLRDGLGATMKIALLSQLFGTALGCLVCYLLTRKNRFARGIASFYSGLINGLPIVVLLMMSYYIIFGSTDISGVLIAVAAFSMVEGASIGGNLNGAIGTVDPVQIEAARSLGFSKTQTFFTVTLPQAIRVALPGYTGGFVSLIKATAIVGYIAIQDLSRAGDIIRSRTYDAYFPILFVGIIYLVITWICVRIFKLILRKTGVAK
ncbi:MAG: transporter substrate-binding domain-containing protein [Oscillospiraceae bacterium]|jgi:polar amino acid transport system substrate-binding protein|nr:transporter substrate-binding domain-containing protein [Oscillospiraceae bacterium]